jgi:hypothetical protein
MEEITYDKIEEKLLNLTNYDSILLYRKNKKELKFLNNAIESAYDQVFYVNFSDSFSTNQNNYKTISLKDILFKFYSNHNLNNLQLNFMIDTISINFSSQFLNYSLEDKHETLYEVLKIIILHFYEKNEYKDYSFERFLEDLDDLNIFLKELENKHKNLMKKFAACFNENDKQLKDELKDMLRLDIENILFDDKILEYGKISSYFILNPKNKALLYQFRINLKTYEFKDLLITENNLSSGQNKKIIKTYYLNNDTLDAKQINQLGMLMINLHDEKLYEGKKLIVFKNIKREIDLNAIINSSSIPLIFMQDNFMHHKNTVHIKEVILLDRIDPIHQFAYNGMKSANKEIKIFNLSQ